MLTSIAVNLKNIHFTAQMPYVPFTLVKKSTNHVDIIRNSCVLSVTFSNMGIFDMQSLCMQAHFILLVLEFEHFLKYKLKPLLLCRIYAKAVDIYRLGNIAKFLFHQFFYSRFHKTFAKIFQISFQSSPSSLLSSKFILKFTNRFFKQSI